MARGKGTPVGVAAFFDVDNTVIRGASAFHIARGLRERGYFTNRDIIRYGWEQLKYLVIGESDKQIREMRNEAMSIVKGWSVAEMTAIAEEIYDEVLALRIFPGTKALIDEHQAQGHQVWFVTASPVEVGRMIARRLGATGALGTIVEHEAGYYTGRLVGEMLHGEHKVTAIQELAESTGLDLDQSFAYGDSLNDAPMLGAVGHPCAINPDHRLRRLARQRRWPIKDFRGRSGDGRRGIIRASATGFVWISLATMRAIKHAVLRPFRRRDRATKK